MFQNVTCDELEPRQALIDVTPSHVRAGSLGCATCHVRSASRGMQPNTIAL